MDPVVTFDASYIALCRELRLEREFEAGDVSVAFEVVGGWGQQSWVPAREGELDIAVWADNLKGYRSGRPEPDRGPPSGWTWLPLLHQWLALLVEAGVAEVCLARTADGWQTEGGHRGATPEEACARLWCTVTGRAVTV